MKIVYLRFLPQNTNKIYQEIYQNVKKRAGAYVYLLQDRIKKIVSQNCNSVNNVSIYQSKKNIQKPFVYQIYLLDPSDKQIVETKLKMLQISKTEINQRIQKYNKFLIGTEKLKNKLISNLK